MSHLSEPAHAPRNRLKANEEEPDLRDCAVPRISIYTPPGYTYVDSPRIVKKDEFGPTKKEGEEEKDSTTKRERWPRTIKKCGLKKQKN